MNLIQRAFSVLALLGLLAACEAKPKMLGITGYNYTNRYIDTFSVDGQGGSNVLLSEDDAGGGKTTCCILLRPDTPLPVKVHVEWTFGVEGDLQTGQVFRQAETHQADVDLNGPLPDKPTLFVVHFYPDNTVQVEVAATYPEPRVRQAVQTSNQP